MSAQHTPGPWHWDSDPIKGDPLGRVRYRVTTTGKTVTQCYYSSSDEQAEWDARLIAAAPELLQALQITYDALCISYPLHSSDMDKRLAIMEQARAAITKATGGAA